MHNLIIGITTISSRLDHIHSVVESLLNQDFPHDTYQVRLYLSKQPYLLDKGCPKITEHLSRLLYKNSHRFSLRYVKNIGPYRKIVPVLEDVYGLTSAQFYNTLIVTADDDTVYPPWWLWCLYENYLNHRCVIGFRARAMVFEDTKLASYKKWSLNITDNPSVFNTPTGKDGVLYSPLNLYPMVRDIDSAKRCAPKADDLWLKANTLLAGVPSFIINNRLADEFPSVTGRESKVSLYTAFNKQGGNNDALTKIEKHIQMMYGLRFWDLCHPSETSIAHVTQDITGALRRMSYVA